jgi:hypothetical protein
LNTNYLLSTIQGTGGIETVVPALKELTTQGRDRQEKFQSNVISIAKIHAMYIGNARRDKELA